MTIALCIAASILAVLSLVHITRSREYLEIESDRHVSMRKTITLLEEVITAQQAYIELLTNNNEQKPIDKKQEEDDESSVKI